MASLQERNRSSRVLFCYSGKSHTRAIAVRGEPTYCLVCEQREHRPAAVVSITQKEPGRYQTGLRTEPQERGRQPQARLGWQD